MVIFAHLADCHVGAWREPRMRELNLRAFELAIDTCISEKVAFAIIAGDLFNTAFPPVEALVLVTRKLKQLANAHIPVYAIPGSHDFSPSGTTILDVLEEAGLLINVARCTMTPEGKLRLVYTTDSKTGIKLTGLIGKKGGHDKDYYAILDREAAQQEAGEKIFVFHCAITELKTEELKEMDAMPASLLPAGFNYYAGGHVHSLYLKSGETEDYKGGPSPAGSALQEEAERPTKQTEYLVPRHEPIRQNKIQPPLIVYPGPTFPNNFAELAKLKHGSMIIVKDWKPRSVQLPTPPVTYLEITSDHQTPNQIQDTIIQKITQANLTGTILLIKTAGTLSEGSTGNIAWNAITDQATNKRAICVLRNTAGLVGPEHTSIKVTSANITDMENTLIKEHAPKQPLHGEKDFALIQNLLNTLSAEKEDGERVADFEQRVMKTTDAIVENETKK